MLCLQLPFWSFGRSSTQNVYVNPTRYSPPRKCARVMPTDKRLSLEYQTA